MQNNFCYLIYKFWKFHWDQACMASATASKTIGGQIKNLHKKSLCIDSPDLIPVLLDFGIKVTGFWKVVLVPRHFPAFTLIFIKIHEVIWIISETKTMPFFNFVSHETKSMILRKFWVWPPSVFEAVAEAIHNWSQWNFQNL